jgi:hypothetical protein
MRCGFWRRRAHYSSRRSSLMNQGAFLMRGLDNVRAEFSLTALVRPLQRDRELRPEGWTGLGLPVIGKVPRNARTPQYPAEKMTSWPVSTRVGNVKNNDANLIEPAALAG